MILYTNGCSHVAAGEAVNEFCFAEDDSLYYALGRQPHPDNLAASFSAILANSLGAILDCNAEAAASNDRILRTTNEYIDNQHDEDFVVLIGWTTWEREEWLHEGEYYQVNGSGIDQVPKELATKYKQWVIDTNSKWREHHIKWHNRIWDLHCKFKDENIKHLFFNSHVPLDLVPKSQRKQWGDNYILPYASDYTYFNYLNSKGFRRRPGSAKDLGGGHYLADGHQEWADFLLPHLTKLL